MATDSVFRFAGLDLEQTEHVHKIGTDAVALSTRVEAGQANTLLDIGSGTGVLALVLLKRYPQLSAVALDPAPLAAALTQSNVLRNQFALRCNTVQLALDEFKRQTSQKFDCIISNPPYFSEGTVAPARHRSMARSQSVLPPAVFMDACGAILQQQGKLWVILPESQVQRYAENACLHGLYFNLISIVMRADGQPTGRVILCFSRHAASLHRETYYMPDAPMYRVE